MYKFLPYMTNDFSVGLYNEAADDIYHSAFGALSEAYEKFIEPVESLGFIKNNKNINVLDICFGIGYNTKAFLNEIFSLDNPRNYNVSIDCVDNNETLMKLSPFISSNISFIKYLFHKNDLYKNIKDYKQADKIVHNNKILKSKYKIQPCVNMILIEKLIKDFGNEFLDKSTLKNFITKQNKIFFDELSLKSYKFLSDNRVLLDQNKNKSTYLHNIYYGNVSKQYNKLYNIQEDNCFNIHFYANDIRSFIKKSTKQYDLVFLDGFTPSKCPCIWSIDFFEELSKHINNDGLIVTYNSSAVVRKAMADAGFFVGNSLNKKNKIIGTIASKNSSKIKTKLSDKELGLLNTKAGIPYRDKNLILDNDTIMLNRKNEVENSTLESSSKFLKRYCNEI